jgi:protocatechuate 3,4-dioxygenase beta subunit
MNDHDHDEPHDHAHDGGLAHDLPRLLQRRGVLGLLGGIGAVTLVGCGPENTDLTDASATTATTSTSTDTVTAGEEIPEETSGPYPGDGSNGPDILSQSGVVRSDITSSFGAASGVAAGVPLTIRLKVMDTSGDEVVPLEGAAVYLWHCDRDGNYSMYSSAVANENYLRGVQAADATGALEFTSIFPAAYSGRWPHIHFEIYPSIADATSASNRLRTSQLAFPEDVCQEVYDNADGYDASVANLAQTSLATDMVFSDGYSLQMAKVTGSVSEGYVATLTVPV